MILSDPQDADGGWARSVPDALGSGDALSGSSATAADTESSLDLEEERQKGYDAGYAEGIAAAQLQAQDLVTQMSGLLRAMAAPFEERDAVLLRELLALTERVVRAVIGRELDTRVDIEGVLSDALSALGSVSVPVTLLLNPVDAAVCRDFEFLADAHFVLTEIPAVARGRL